MVEGGGSISYGCKLDLASVQRALTGEKYCTDILNSNRSVAF